MGSKKSYSIGKQELLDKIREVLRFYADGEFYEVEDPYEKYIIILKDEGEKAQEILDLLEEEYYNKNDGN